MPSSTTLKRQESALYFESISFSHVRRKANGVADKLAKIAKFFHAPRMWFDDIPSDVTQLVLSDRSFCWLMKIKFCFLQKRKRKRRCVIVEKNQKSDGKNFTAAQQAKSIQGNNYMNYNQITSKSNMKKRQLNTHKLSLELVSLHL